ncbi:4'-phosphopantetheinyl transferase superfamily protein [Streptomyces sp. ITFR-16]|uniref:4'-phosphopantetheinyl transferase family protein n=1 Tax=Streptomyces sp. ITFR-16 TaxID=3075198 RepID=UPI00288AC191|nr:4'-phosphopantetheinyl transferase superfamily protein [Streptomyces sp. ITFR-16]WNI21047.1 hypothetical protein RLT58_03500 [Streptomyces sp. ITFR-16]
MTNGPEPGASRLPAGQGRARAALARTSEVLDRRGLTEDLLAPWERQRLDRIRIPARRDDVMAARLLVRHLTAQYVGCPRREVEIRQRCPDCGESGHGRPYLPTHPGTGISLSHADGLVAAVVGPGPVGVDVEQAHRRPPPPARFARRFPGQDTALRAVAATTDPDAALLRLWVQAEAGFKAGGGDLRVETWSERGAVAAVATAKTVPVRHVGWGGGRRH